MELEFKFSTEEANVILLSLSKQPYESVAGLIGKIQGQAATQLKPKEDEKLKKSK